MQCVILCFSLLVIEFAAALRYLKDCLMTSDSIRLSNVPKHEHRRIPAAHRRWRQTEAA